jgi:hypothetical protein
MCVITLLTTHTLYISTKLNYEVLISSMFLIVKTAFQRDTLNKS